MQSGTIDVRGCKTYHEVHGDGSPLLLLHGGFQVIDTLAQQTQELKQRFAVHLPEGRGHGRIPDVPRYGFDVTASRKS